ncbi:MAG: HlyD family efflux transporter periplasmic adaptor subunit [Balneolaceae bacterium]
MELKNAAGIVAILLLTISCNDRQLSDAYGQFEANEITLSAEASGVLQDFKVEEGTGLDAGEIIGQIDTTQLFLRKTELQASIKSIQTNIARLNAQADVYKEQLETAQKDLQRFTSLQEDNAATQQQIDQAQGQVNSLQKQITSVEVQKQSVYTEMETMEVKILQVEDQIKRATIINPVTGTVLSKFVEPHELISQGNPLYRMANLEELILRVYVSGVQFSNLTLGQEVEVLIDKSAEENERLNGKVSWISTRAEFTPRMIQTKEERVTQVYAVKVKVPNPDGKLKIGMPGEVSFGISN